MATSSGLPWWKLPPDSPGDAAIEESLRRAMDEDPRLASGAGPLRADNVLDFIQMTGLTTGRLPEPHATTAPRPAAVAEEPISFFEIGVRDVDGSGDPGEPTHADLDLDVFKPATPRVAEDVSRSLIELKQIIADLASETDPARPTYARLTLPEAAYETPAAERAPIAQSPPDWASLPTIELPEPKAPGWPSSPVVPSESRDAETPTVSLRAEPKIADSQAPAHPMREPAAGLAIARELVRELSQANEAAAEKLRTAKGITLDLKHPVTAAREQLPEPDVEREDFSSHSHLGLPRRRHHSVLRRWAPRVAMAVLIALLGFGAYEGFKRSIQPPRAAFQAAQALLDAGQNRAASDAFLSFAKRYDGYPDAPLALFNAGYALQLEPPVPAAKAKEAYSEALGILEKFTAAYPNHEKIARAETLMGLLYYKTGRNLEAISLLGDPERRVRDPGAYLLALRTLARAYVELGQTDNARSAFLRAASLESNMAPDQDYVELATVYQDLGARAGDPVQRRKYFTQAIEQWDFAMQVPGLIKARKDDIKLLRDAAASKLNAVAAANSPGTGSATTGATPAAGQVSERAPK